MIRSIRDRPHSFKKASLVIFFLPKKQKRILSTLRKSGATQLHCSLRFCIKLIMLQIQMFIYAFHPSSSNTYARNIYPHPIILLLECTNDKVADLHWRTDDSISQYNLRKINDFMEKILSILWVFFMTRLERKDEEITLFSCERVQFLQHSLNILTY